MRVLVSDPIGQEGIEILRGNAEVDIKPDLKPDELVSIIGDYEALVVRSQTRVTAEVLEAGKKLQVVARAGVGTDNIDVDVATRRGILVVNAPTSNTISATEHTIALMLALARHVAQANASLKAGEWRRNDFVGTEVRNKVLGIVGLGNVGSEVARRALGLEMELIAYDPYIAEDYARNFQVELVTLDELLKRSDFITLHAPLTKLTKEIIGEKELSLVKPTVRIINTARGGLINEKALVEAIRAKKVGGAAFDVFDTEPIISSILFEEDNIIVTPHLGASTAEAQAMVAEDIAEQIIDVFNGEPARYAVNAPFISAETMSGLSPFIRAAGAAGKLASQLIDGKTSSVQIKYDGEISHYDTNALKAAVLGGLLDQISEERVNLVNANIVAARRGMKIVEQKDTICENYTNLITAEISSGSESVVVATTVIRGETHIVRVNDYWIDIYPCEGYFLFCNHLDRPGLLGSVGKITGDANINISAMHVGRLKPRGQALMILLLDEVLPEKHRQQLLALTDMYSTRMVKL